MLDILYKKLMNARWSAFFECRLKEHAMSGCRITCWMHQVNAGWWGSLAMGKWNRECFESICQAHNLMTRRCATRLRELRKIIIDRARMHTDTEDTPNCATLRYTSKPLIEYYNHTPIIHPTCLYVYSIVISIS